MRTWIRRLVDRLRADEHNVVYIAETEAEIDDPPVLDRSRRDGAVLLTADKDFGDLVFRQRLLHAGILLVRLAGVEPAVKASLVASAFRQHEEELIKGFAVLSKRSLRFRKVNP